MTEALPAEIVADVAVMLRGRRVPVDADLQAQVLGAEAGADGCLRVRWIAFGQARTTEIRLTVEVDGDSDAEGIVDMVRYELAESVEARDA